MAIHGIKPVAEVHNYLLDDINCLEYEPDWEFDIWDMVDDFINGKSGRSK